MNEADKLISEKERIKRVKRQIERYLLTLCRKDPAFSGVVDLKLKWHNGHLTGGVKRNDEEDLNWEGLSKFAK